MRLEGWMGGWVDTWVIEWMSEWDGLFQDGLICRWNDRKVGGKGFIDGGLYGLKDG